MADITLPVSLGEALDKLTILDIKINKIQDDRRLDCQKEYDILYSTLKPYVKEYEFHYKILKEINQTIWDIQDKCHLTNSKDEIQRYYTNILKENDRRFRVKKKINISSTLKEQKGYALKRCFIYTHLGLGDMFWMNGAIRYYATCYDETIVVCKKNNEKVVREMYSDDPTIVFQIINDDSELYPFEPRRYYLQDEGVDVFTCGYHTANPMIYDFPLSFYDNMNLNREVRQSYFYIKKLENSKKLYEYVKGNIKSYFLIHQNSSQMKIDIFRPLQKKYKNTCILDINQNNYPRDHHYFEVAEGVVGKPMLDYIDLIENAEGIYCLESSFYCLATHLDLSKVKDKVCFYPCDDSANRLRVFTTGDLLKI